jgi:hypothetical protein
MFKGARVGCGLAATICIGAHGQLPTRIVRHGKLMELGVEADGTISDSEGASHSLLQGTTVSSTNKYQMQSAKLLQELEKLTNGAKELPASIRQFIDLINTNAGEIQTIMTSEHNTAAADLDAKFKAFTTCDTELKAVQAGVSAANGENANATNAAQALCECWQDEWKFGLDSDGCQGELSCRNADVAAKLKKQKEFLVVGDTPVDQYGTEVCANSAGWQQQGSGTNTARALAWFDSQAEDAKTHWAGKRKSLQTLIDAHTTAKDLRDDVRDGSKTKKGCTELSTIKSDKEKECILQKGVTEKAYCKYATTLKTGCAEYDKCRKDANTAWTAAKVRETKDSQDRKDAWLATDMVKCITLAFSNNTEGKIQIDSAKTEACSKLKCDTDSCTALDLSTSLGREPPTKLECEIPDPTPPCSCNQGGWKAVLPLYFVGARTVPECAPDPVSVTSANVADKTCAGCP